MELGDRLRDLTEVSEVTRVAAEVAGTALGASRAGFGRLDATGEHVSVEPDWTAPGQASVAGRHRFADYGDFHRGLLRGELLVIHDATTDPRTAAFAPALRGMDAAAFVDVPLRERGSTVALFFVHDRVRRTWTSEELAFMRAVADRVEVGVARLRAEERQRLLNHELSHRMKNLFAMVQAVATQTLRGTTDVEAAREVLARRLIALGKAHDILLGGVAERAPLAAVVREGIGVLEEASERVEVSGPEVEVGGKAALSLALMLHEMTTNAIKYGALSVPGGSVELSWSVVSGRGGTEPQDLLARARRSPCRAPGPQGLRDTPDRTGADRTGRRNPPARLPSRGRNLRRRSTVRQLPGRGAAAGSHRRRRLIVGTSVAPHTRPWDVCSS